MQRRRLPVGCFFYVLIVLAGVLFAVYSLNRMDKAEHRAELAEKKNKAIQQIDSTDAYKANQEFINHFFNYDSTKQRYEGLKPLMTDLGYSSLFPSEGPDIPSSTVLNVVSRMVNFKSYEYRPQRTTSEFISEFDLSTTYNDITTTQTVLVRTILVNSEGGSWKVSNFEFIGNLTGRNEK